MSAARPARQAGFTVTEVMIVLAIAGLILLIVFLAVPTLQRSGRNNQRRQDVQAILAAVSQYELNNSGAVPSTADLRTFLNNYYSNKLSYYAADSVTVADNSDVNNLQPRVNPTNLDEVKIYNQAKCLDNGNGTPTGASYSDVIALYSIESGNNVTSHQCQQL